MNRFTTPTNEDRAERAQQVLDFYASLQGMDEDSALTDLLADIMHWCGEADVSFYDRLRVAQVHFEAECDEARTMTVDPRPALRSRGMGLVNGVREDAPEYYRGDQDDDIYLESPLARRLGNLLDEKWADLLTQEHRDTIQRAAAALDHYSEIHDGLSDMIENGRLCEHDIPDDYRWLVEMLVEGVGLNGTHV